MMLDFQKGMVDWTSVPVGQVAASRSLPQVKSGAWKVETTPNLALRYLCSNWKDPVVGGAKGLQLRQALAYGCDRQAVSDASSGGVYLAAHHRGRPAGRARRPRRSGALSLRSGEGEGAAQAHRPRHTQARLPIGQQQQGTVRSLTANYAKIGIAIKAKGMVCRHDVRYVLAGKPQSFLAGWLADYPSMDNFLYPLFESISRRRAARPTRTPRSTPSLHRLAPRTDQEARLQRYAEAEQLILVDSPMIPLIVMADAGSSTAGSRTSASTRWAGWTFGELDQLGEPAMSIRTKFLIACLCCALIPLTAYAGYPTRARCSTSTGSRTVSWRRGRWR